MIPLFDSLPSLADALRNGDVSLADYLDRLEARFEAREPSVLAFLPEANRFERLRREARALVDEYPHPASRPPLFGVPVGVKDIFHVSGFATRAGSRLPPEVLQGAEAAAVTALKRAGALVMGKTVTTDFAYFGPGPTRNPHNPEHTPGGSSSGSAAAVAAGLCPLAFGTQTIGSIIRPASFCGIVGYKPTCDRISTAGVIPLAPSLDHVGVFASDVAGVRLAASLLCRAWGHDAPAARPVLGIPEGPYLSYAGPEMLDHFREACDRLAAAGYEIRRVDAMPDFDDVYERHNRIVAAEAARVHEVWFARHRDLYHPQTADLILRGQSVPAETLAQDLEGRDALRDRLAGAMTEHGLDLWVSPAAPGPAPRGLESTGNPVMNLPWTYCGMPAISIPSGKSSGGLPLGLQFAGHWSADETLLDWAGEMEGILLGV